MSSKFELNRRAVGGGVLSTWVAAFTSPLNANTAASFPTLGQALAANPLVGTTVRIDGFSAPGDGGGFTGFVEQAANRTNPAAGYISPVEGQPLSPEMWGARGDYDFAANAGTDDYGAWAGLAAFTRRHSGRSFVIRCAGGRNYYLNRIKINREFGVTPYPFPSGQAEPGDIYFTDNPSISLDFNGANLVMKGDMYRSADAIHANRFPYSWKRNLSLTFRRIGDLTVQNGRIDGRVDLMTRDKDVTAGACHGIAILSCGTATLRNIAVERFAGDSVIVGGWSYADNGLDGAQTSAKTRQITDRLFMENAVLARSGRQGLSIVGVRESIIGAGCVFAEIGNTGNYGSHKPSAGIDVEPNHSNAAPTEFVAIRPGVRFEDCLGQPMTANNRVGRIEVEGVRVNRSRVESSEYFLLAAKSVSIRGCEFVNSSPTCNFGAKRVKHVTAVIEDNTIQHSLPVPKRNWLYDRGDFDIRWRRNRISVATGAPLEQLFLMRAAEFSDNSIFIDASGHRGNKPLHFIGRFTAAIMSNNRFSTNLQGPRRWFGIKVGQKADIARNTFEGNIRPR